MTDGPALASSTERALIDRIRARLDAPPPWLRVGPGDDAAVVDPERNLCDVVTTDVCVEGVHFDRAFVPPDAIGHRALAVNLSDLAAMGAKPRLATLSLVLPPSLDLEVFDAVLDGFLALARVHRTTIVGGNLSRSPGPLVVDVTAIGTVHRRKILRRAGARPGDAVYVSGTLGDARAGLEQCRNGVQEQTGEPLRARALRPDPRVRLGMLLGRTQTASSCMDLSDGLADALSQVAEASGVQLQIDAALLPIRPEARLWFEARGADPLRAALAGGDDYELLFTVPGRRRGRLQNVARLIAGLPLTRIGSVTRGAGVIVQRSDRTDELPAGFSHFGGG
jgi:thiamine-monophosphate kinase